MPMPLFVVQNVTASVPVASLLYIGPLVQVFMFPLEGSNENVTIRSAIKGASKKYLTSTAISQIRLNILLGYMNFSRSFARFVYINFTSYMGFR